MTSNTEHGLSLWQIDNTIAELVSMREEVQTDEERAAIDGQIEHWVTQELQKFDRCYGYIRREEQQAEIARQVAREAVGWQHTHENRALRMRATILRVMQARNQRHAEGPGVGSFTVRSNGGLQPLEITDEAKIPPTFRMVEVRMDQSTWEAVQLFLEGQEVILRKLLATVKVSIDNKRVRAALEAGEDVPGAFLGPRGTSLMVR